MRAAACCESHRTAGGAHPAPTTARPEGGAKDEAANETAASIVVSGKDRCRFLVSGELRKFHEPVPLRKFRVRSILPEKF